MSLQFIAVIKLTYTILYLSTILINSHAKHCYFPEKVFRLYTLQQKNSFPCLLSKNLIKKKIFFSLKRLLRAKDFLLKYIFLGRI